MAAPAAASAVAQLAGGIAAAASTVSAQVGTMSLDADDPLLADSPPTIVALDVGTHFANLTEQQQLYAHHVARAAFHGTRIICRQISAESETIFDLILALHRACNGAWTELADRAGLSAQELGWFLEYAALFLGNLGNYKGFGDTKFVPRLPQDKFANLAAADPEAKKLWDALKEPDKTLYMDKQNPKTANLGFVDQGHVSGYYPNSPTITKDEIEKVDAFIAKQGVLPENTRLTKTSTGDFEMLIASVTTRPAKDQLDSERRIADLGRVPDMKKDSRARLTFGDHSKEMQKIAHHIREAAKYAANETQQKMMDQYAISFETGSLKAFKESQKLWVTDLQPAVETNIGFIETYRDPAGIRGEWEGFAAVVNMERTRAFSKLVEAAKPMIAKLPWPAEFESETFTPPDFTSLEVIAFATSEPPAGINLPNYDDVRRNIGFKNVSLGNILSAKGKNEPVPFISEKDLAVYEKNRDPAFEVQVGVHELLGHGSGKLLQETEPGKYNFDVQNPPQSPIDSQPVKSWYKPNETFTSVFGALHAPYEECRAECVAMALSCDFEVLRIFGHGDGSEDIDGPAGDVLFAAYLQMARAGLMAVKYWDPTARKWGQAHMQARFAITQAFLRAGEGFVQLHWKAEDLSDLTVSVDRAKITTVGRRAVETFLQKLHVYKATADVAKARTLFEDMTAVDDFWGSKVRRAVLARDIPRKQFVQASTSLKDGKVAFKEYEPTLEGMIQSWAEREV